MISVSVLASLWVIYFKVNFEFTAISYYFNFTDYLIGELELRCFNLKLTESPVPEALFSMNADIDLVLDIYTHVVTANDRVWLADHDELFLIRSVKRLLSLIILKYLPISKNR
jgi:hypothetical protein